MTTSFTSAENVTHTVRPTFVVVSPPCLRYRMRVEPAALQDVPAVRAAYAYARTIQLEQKAAAWPEFTEASIRTEVVTGRLCRVLDGNALVGVFSVAYEDEAIWGEQERGQHIYLHRIARAAAHHGRGLVAAVLGWARMQCRACGRAGLRMDTWASNEALIAFYERQVMCTVARGPFSSRPLSAPPS